MAAALIADRGLAAGFGKSFGGSTTKMRATFALFIASGLVLGGATMAPQANAVSTGRGGDVPNPQATTPPTPGLGAYNEYDGTAPSTPNAPGMGAYNGINAYNGYAGYGENGVAPTPAGTPVSGVPVSGGRAPVTVQTGPPAPVSSVPAPGLPAAAQPLAISRATVAVPPGSGRCTFPNPTTGDITGCQAETNVTFTVEQGVLALTCPDWAPANGANGVYDLEGTPGSALTIPIGACSIADFRGEPASGSWTVSAEMDQPFTYTPPASEPEQAPEELPNQDVNYVIPQYGATDPAGANLNNLAPGPNGVNLATQQEVLRTTAAAVYGATWSPNLVVNIPSEAEVTAPGTEFLGVLTTSVTGGSAG